MPPQQETPVTKGQLVALEGGGYGIIVATEPVVRVVDLGPARDYGLTVETI